MSPERFFELELRRHLDHGAVRPDVAGRVLFEVTGAPKGRWLLELGPKPSIERAPRVRSADLFVRIDAAAFDQFVAGTVDAEHISVIGDPRLLAALADVWTLPKGLVSVRL